jgi:hypothetical protein
MAMKVSVSRFALLYIRLKLALFCPTVFGFLDGIGQPPVSGFTITPVPGQEIINPGIILLGEPGDTMSRPSWAKDGSFLVFRQLQQLVPEFDDFVVNNAPPVTGLTASQASDLFGARMIGRWKSVCGRRAPLSLPCANGVPRHPRENQSTLVRCSTILLRLSLPHRITISIIRTPDPIWRRIKVIARSPHT